MGHRLSRIYTRTGDGGTTGLGDGSRTDKDAARVEAYGTVDELNSVLGMVLAYPELPLATSEPLVAIQHDLFDLGGELCIPGHTVLDASHVQRLEHWLDALNGDLPPLKEFILPGGGAAAATCHLARTIARRAERRVVRLARAEAVNEHALAYLNRLSDLLFVMARYLNRESGHADVLWQRARKGGRT